MYSQKGLSSKVEAFYAFGLRSGKPAALRPEEDSENGKGAERSREGEKGDHCGNHSFGGLVYVCRCGGNGANKGADSATGSAPQSGAQDTSEDSSGCTAVQDENFEPHTDDNGIHHSYYGLTFKVPEKWYVPIDAMNVGACGIIPKEDSGFTGYNQILIFSLAQPGSAEYVYNFLADGFEYGTIEKSAGHYVTYGDNKY